MQKRKRGKQKLKTYGRFRDTQKEMKQGRDDGIKQFSIKARTYLSH